MLKIKLLILKKYYKRIRKKYFSLINGKLAGDFSPKAFKIKRNMLVKLGYKIGEGTKIVGPLFISSKLEVGKNSFIGRCATFEGDGLVSIGDNVDIGPNVVFNTGGHLVGDSKRRAGKGLICNIRIEDGCWIGNRSTLFNNITIGKSSVVGACSVVFKSFDSNALIVGNPANIKKYY